MGMINGRNVFSRASSSATSHRGNGNRSNEKKRWSVVRLYLCGDEEFDSVLAEEDSASVKSSEATIASNQPYASSNGEMIEHTMLYQQEEDAAIIIQAAFRRLMARCRDGEAKMEDDEQQEMQEIESGSPGKFSVSTSIEVQTGNSIDVLSTTEENSGAHCNNQLQKKTRTQISRSKEDWDDSTLSSNVLRMRIQNRLEATNRRERALAYAFSQQLRICSRNKQERPDCKQSNKSWHWLERWMATRVPDFSLESHSSKQLEEKANNFHTEAVGKKGRYFDLAVEEKESCGSNDVPVLAESFPVKNVETRKKTKPGRNISRRKTVPSHYQCPKEPTVTNSPVQSRTIMHKKDRQLQRSNSNREIKCIDASSTL